MVYKLLIFDADNTLFDFEYAEKEAISRIAKELKLKSPLTEIFEIYQQINKQIWKEYEEKKISANKLKIERFRRFFAEFNFKVDEEYFSKRYLYYLSTVNKLIPGAYSLIEEFSKRYKIAIVTNGFALVQKPRFQNSDIKNFIDSYIISEEVGVSKPQPEIFQLACNKIGKFAKSEILVIGDNFSSDIIGGINFGVDTCWFNFNHEINSSGLIPKYEIHSLIELKQFL